MLNADFSRRLAIAGGMILPMLETVRRWKEWPGPVDTWIPWLDDYILGGILLAAAWLSRAGPKNADRHGMLGFRRTSWLTAAWGFVSGCGFGSTLAQLQYVIHPGLNAYVDPSGVGHGWIVLAKAALVSVGLLGLFTSMRVVPQKRECAAE